MGINPLNLSSIKEALPPLGLNDADVPDPKKLIEDIGSPELPAGKYPPLLIKDAYNEDGKLDFPNIEKGIAYYQAQHEKKRSLAKSLLNLGTLILGSKALLANQQALLNEETAKTENPALKQLQRISNLPANLLNKGAQPKLDKEQFQILQDAMPAFSLGNGRSQYEKVDKNALESSLSKLIKPLIFVSSKFMSALGTLKIAALALNMLEKSDPQANPRPNLETSNFLNDLADHGLKFFPLVKSLGDLNRVVDTTKGNIFMAVNGSAGLLTNGLLLKNNWHDVSEFLSQRNKQGERVLIKQVFNSLSFLDLDETKKELIKNKLDDLIDFAERNKPEFKESPNTKRIEALSTAFKGLSFLGDNRGEAVRDQGTIAAKLSQRFMSIILDLPANTMLAARTLGLFKKLKDHENISDDDISGIEKGINLKSSAIMAEKLLVSTVQNGFMKMKIDFGGSLANLKALEAWKTRFDSWSTGLTNATFLPFAGTLFEPIKKWVNMSINNREKVILRSGITDKIPNFKAGPIKEV